MYNYTVEKQKLFTEEGFKQFIKIYIKCMKLIDIAGVARMDKIMEGEGWSYLLSMTCIDMLIELDILKEIPNSDIFAQYRVFTKLRGED